CINMDAVIVDKLRQPFYYDAIPIGPAVLSATDQLDARISPLHDLGKLNRLLDIIFRAQPADLPATIHLVAQAPVSDVIWLLMPVLPSQIGPIGVARPVTVLYPRLCLVHRPAAHVHTQVGFNIYGAAILNKLICTKAV